MSASDGLVWVLVWGALVLGAAGALVAVHLAGWRRPADATPNLAAGDGHANRPRSHSADPPVDPRAGPAPDSLASEAVPRAIHALLLTLVAERAAHASSGLVLSPPMRSSNMVWHIHLNPMVALDVRDGRTIPLPSPSPTHCWRLPSGLGVDVAWGGPGGRSTGASLAMRVESAYVRVTLGADGDRWRTLAATVLGDPRGTSDLRADLASWTAVEAALRQAIDLALGGVARAPAPALGYGGAAWDSHERTWIMPRTGGGMGREEKECGV